MRRREAEELRSRLATVERGLFLVIAAAVGLAAVLSAAAVYLKILGEQTAAIIGVIWTASTVAIGLLGLVTRKQL